MIWVVSTNSNLCRIYHYQKKPPEVTLIKELTHSASRPKNGEFLTSDKQGHYKSSESNRGAYSPHTEPKEVEWEVFSRQIAHELEEGRNAHAYDKLIIIAPPHMSGLLFQHLNKHIQELITHNIHKEIQSLDHRELLEFLQTNTRYSGKS